MDNEIKKALEQITSEYSPGENIYNNIARELKGEMNMKKKINIKKFAVCFAAAVVVLSVGVAAGSRYAASISGGASWLDYIDHAPTNEEISKEVDYMPKHPEKMGDFTLSGAQPGNSSYKDESGSVMEETKDISFEYHNGDVHVTLFTDNATTVKPPENVTGSINGIDVSYSKVFNKFVPPDYKATEEELEKAKNGEINLAYGSIEVEEKISESMIWTENGINYHILSMGNDELGEDTLMQMAEDVINS